MLVFIDLLLKVLVLVPVISSCGVPSLVALFVILNVLQGCLVWGVLVENKRICGLVPTYFNCCCSVRDHSETKNPSANVNKNTPNFIDPQSATLDEEFDSRPPTPTTRTSELRRAFVRRDSIQALVRGKVPQRGSHDVYDKGLHLDSLDRLKTPCCCCYCGEAYYNWWGP